MKFNQQTISKYCMIFREYLQVIILKWSLPREENRDEIYSINTERLVPDFPGPTVGPVQVFERPGSGKCQK